MVKSEYKLQLYSPGLLPQVVELLQPLWQDDFDTNLSSFRWKHLENPYIENPLAIVALKDGKVAGFRSYFATKWAVDPGDLEFIMLSPGDTIVHPDHRRKGLSVAMGKQAMREFADTYKIYLNTSCIDTSFPGYTKLGFSPIIPKVLLTVYQKLSFKHYIFELIKENIKNFKTIKAVKTFFDNKTYRNPIGPPPPSYLGEFGNIVVSDSPKPKEMSKLVLRNVTANPKIRISQDEDFFLWRFQNPRKKYIYYYFNSQDGLKGYVVLGLRNNYSDGKIIDYSADDVAILEALLNFIFRSKVYNKVQIYNYGLRQNLTEALENIGLIKQNISKQTAKLEKGALPLLVRPVKGEPTEDDWCICGLDVRDIDTWDLIPICCDGE